MKTEKLINKPVKQLNQYCTILTIMRKQ